MKTKTTREKSLAGGAAPTSVQGELRPAPALLPPVRPRRRPLAALGLGLALTVVGGLGVGGVVLSAGDKTSVLVIAQDVPRGGLVDAGTLRTARIGVEGGVSTVPADQLEQLVGQRAAYDLRAGALLTPDALTDAVVPSKGQALVGIALKPAQLPTEPLQPGDLVEVVITPGPDEDVPTTAPDATTAEVVSVTTSDIAELTTVNVTAPAREARRLAIMVATGRVALVLSARER